jgi:hypothetical protein
MATNKKKKKKKKKKYSGQQQKEIDYDEPHPTPNEKTQPIQWTERPTGALAAVNSLWPFVAHMFCTPFHIVPTTPRCFSTHTLLKPFTTIILLLDLINQKQLLHVVLQHAIHLQVCALPDLEGIPSTLVAKTTRLLVLSKLGCRN